MVLKQNFSMEKITVSKIDNIFISRPIDEIVTNKLFCTFIQREDLNETISTITGQYKILYDKIFVLESKQTDEYICTYNIDSVNFDNQVHFAKLEDLFSEYGEDRYRPSPFLKRKVRENHLFNSK